MGHVLIPHVNRFRTVYLCECGEQIAWTPIEYLGDNEVWERVRQRHHEHRKLIAKTAVQEGREG